MAHEVNIRKTSGAGATVVDDENAAEFAEVYAMLKDMPVNNAADVDFDSAKEARRYSAEGRAWAAENGLVFTRKGDIKNNPKRVSYRIYEAGETRGPLTDKEKAQRAATRAANKAAKEAAEASE
jgi:hypothetical protein